MKLDVIPADLIESVQINKTLQPNMNGDAIGGSVNLVTKKAGDQPTLSVYGLGGFTPIANTRVYMSSEARPESASVLPSAWARW